MRDSQKGTEAVPEKGQVTDVISRQLPRPNFGRTIRIVDVDGNDLSAFHIRAGHENKRAACFLLYDQVPCTAPQGLEACRRRLGRLHAAEGKVPDQFHVTAAPRAVLTRLNRQGTAEQERGHAEHKGRVNAHVGTDLNEKGL
jgi:hypothetical protein